MLTRTMDTTGSRKVSGEGTTPSLERATTSFDDGNVGAVDVIADGQASEGLSALEPSQYPSERQEFVALSQRSMVGDAARASSGPMVIQVAASTSADEHNLEIEESSITGYHFDSLMRGSCTTESSRSSPSHDGSSVSGHHPIGRGRSSSLDSTKKSTKSKSGSGLRRGKWTVEEENYVARVIQDFNSGFLDAPAGTTLRTYLSEKLQCDPMRITKKFTGDSCIGKRVFHPVVRSPSNAAAIDRAQVCWIIRLRLVIQGSTHYACLISTFQPCLLTG
jgi:hypothetical protein